MIKRAPLLLAASLALAAGCASTPQNTTGVPGGTVKVLRVERRNTPFLGGTLFRQVETRFWVFAEDGVPYTVLESGTVHDQPEDFTVVAWGQGLLPIGELDGQPVRVHYQQLLIGTQEFGPVEDGDTVEFTKQGVFVGGEFRGKWKGT